jgi:hypothetical protein
MAPIYLALLAGSNAHYGGQWAGLKRLQQERPQLKQELYSGCTAAYVGLMHRPCAGLGSLTRFALVRPLPASGADGGFSAGGSWVYLGRTAAGIGARAGSAVRRTQTYCYLLLFRRWANTLVLARVGKASGEMDENLWFCQVGRIGLRENDRLFMGCGPAGPEMGPWILRKKVGFCQVCLTGVGENDRLFWGSGPGAGVSGCVFLEKGQVFSGWRRWMHQKRARREWRAAFFLKKVRFY